MPLEFSLKLSFLVVFTLHTCLWKGSDSFSNKWKQRLQQKLSVLFLFKRLMIDSVQYSLQVWSTYQAEWRWKAKESGTHRISVVHYNRQSLTVSLLLSSPTLTSCIILLLIWPLIERKTHTVGWTFHIEVSNNKKVLHGQLETQTVQNTLQGEKVWHHIFERHSLAG